MIIARFSFLQAVSAVAVFCWGPGGARLTSLGQWWLQFYFCWPHTPWQTHTTELATNLPMWSSRGPSCPHTTCKRQYLWATGLWLCFCLAPSKLTCPVPFTASLCPTLYFEAGYTMFTQSVGHNSTPCWPSNLLCSSRPAVPLTAETHWSTFWLLPTPTIPPLLIGTPKTLSTKNFTH